MIVVSVLGYIAVTLVVFLLVIVIVIVIVEEGEVGAIPGTA